MAKKLTGLPERNTLFSNKLCFYREFPKFKIIGASVGLWKRLLKHSAKINRGHSFNWNTGVVKLISESHTWNSL